MAIIRKIPWTHQPPAFVSQTNENIGDGLIGLFNFNDANCIFHNAAKIKSSVTPAWFQGTPLIAAGNGGRGVRFNVETAGTKDYAALLHDDELPTDGVTILYVRRVRDTTNRQLGHFGLLEDAGAGDRIGAHAPWSDGTIYWDHGGFSGDNRLTWAGYSKNVDVLDKFVFRAGTQGMAIFYNGAKEASSPNASTRTAVPSGNKSFHLGAGQTETIIYGGDAIDVLCFAVWNRELTDSECIGVTRNEWQLFQPRTQVIPLEEAAQTFALIPRRVPWIRQPPIGTPIDRGNPITRGLTLHYLPGEPVDFRSSTQTDQVGVVTTPIGLGETDILNLADDKGAAFGDDQGTMLWYGHLTRTESTGSLPALIGNRNTTGNGWNFHMNIYPNAGGIPHGLIVVSADGAVSTFTLDHANIFTTALRKYVIIGAAKDGEPVESWLKRDNESILTGSTAGCSFGTTTMDVELHTYYDDGAARQLNGAGGANGQCSLAVCWNRRISDAEARSLIANPWQIFEPRTQYIPVGSAVAAGGGQVISGITSISSLETFAADNVLALATAQAITGTVGGIASLEAFATDHIVANVAAQSIASITSIASAEAFATDHIVANVAQGITGTVGEIASAEAFASDNIVALFSAQTITSITSIASLEAFAADNVLSQPAQGITGTVGAIASLEAFAADNVITELQLLIAQDTGIVSDESVPSSLTVGVLISDNPAAYFSHGTTIDINGAVHAVSVGESFGGGVGDVFIAGTRHTVSGAMYVTFDVPSISTATINGLLHTITGIRYVVDAAGVNKWPEGFSAGATGIEGTTTILGGLAIRAINRTTDGRMLIDL